MLICGPASSSIFHANRLIITPLFLALFASVSSAQTSGYRLFSKEGTRSTDPTLAEAGLSLTHVINTIPTRIENGNQLIAKTVTAAELIARKSPDPAATNSQREDLLADETQKLQQLASFLPDRGLSVSFEVVDVVNRPMPTEPKAPKLPASTAARNQYQTAKAAPTTTK